MPRCSARPFAKILDLRESWKRTLLAENKSASTIAVYTSAVDLLASYLDANHGAMTVDEIQRADVEEFIAHLLGTRKPATASNRYRALQAFFGWCVREGEMERSPMETMRPPSVPETPVPVLSDDQLRALLKSCEGKTFEDRRDMAMIRLLLDTGMRRGELAGMTIVDVDFELDVALVVGKGSRPRACPFGKRDCCGARSLPARARAPSAGRPRGAVARPARRGQAERSSTDRREAGPARRHSRSPSAPAPPHVRLVVAFAGRQRG